MSDDLSFQFGNLRVTPEEREQRIRKIFQSVAVRYDLMNDAMSFGIHRLWKRFLVRRILAEGGGMVVDLAGGTGDVARLLADRALPSQRIVVCDPSTAMMEIGRQRCSAKVEFVEGKAEVMPFADQSVDVLTIAFGLRNTTSLSVALREIHRVLRPGGLFLCLEFSTPHWLIRPFYNAYSAIVIPRLGAWIAGEPDAYDYLIQSIRHFPDQRSLGHSMEQAGFADVSWRNLSFGIVSLHQGRKA